MDAAVKWLESAQEGDRAAKEALSAWCLRRGFRLAYAGLGNVPNRESLAEEIAGEASLRAMAGLDQIESAERFHAWFHQIVRNCSRTHLSRGSDRTLPPATYQRWLHDFLHAYGPEIEALVQQELGAEPSPPHPLLIQRIATDLSTKSYRQFLHLSYDGRADVVLNTVKEWLKSFVGLEWVTLYDQDAAGEWVEAGLTAEEETEAQVLQIEFIQHVNEHLAVLQPLCRRFIRWYYLEHLRVAEMARLERMSERTAYRRLENCSASFRARLMRDGYFAELVAKRETAAAHAVGPDWEP